MLPNLYVLPFTAKPPTWLFSLSRKFSLPSCEGYYLIDVVLLLCLVLFNSPDTRRENNHKKRLST